MKDDIARIAAIALKDKWQIGEQVDWEHFTDATVDEIAEVLRQIINKDDDDE